MVGMKSSLISQLFGVACNLKLSGLKVLKIYLLVSCGTPLFSPSEFWDAFSLIFKIFLFRPFDFYQVCSCWCMFLGF